MSVSDFSGPVARAEHRAAAAAVVEQRVDRLLQHALLVADDDLGALRSSSFSTGCCG
jgi:hypothetical protein